MPQRVPPFTFSEDARALRRFLYDYWCERGHGPNLRAAAEGTGLSREQIVSAYQELDLGIICVVDHHTQNSNLLKVQPFSSFPSQVEVHIDDRFHCFAGCAMESMALPQMPPFSDREVRLESYCSCCLEPVTIVMKNDTIVSRAPATVRIHVSLSPFEWNRTNIVSMCDAMNFVADTSHADRYERKIARRGVLFELEQAQRFVADTAKHRMFEDDWPPVAVVPERILAGIRALGVDVSNWEG